MSLGLRVLSRKALCGFVTLMLSRASAPAARARSTTIVLTTSSAQAVVDGRSATMLIPPVTDQASQQILVPIGFVARQFGFRVSSVPESVAIALSSAEHTVCVTPGSLETRREQVFMQTVDFSIVRIDMEGKGIRVLSRQSVGSLGTGWYPSAYVSSLKPLALMNATDAGASAWL